jgi:hypothetical protein
MCTQFGAMITLKEKVQAQSNDMSYNLLLKEIDAFIFQRPCAFARLIWEKACIDDDEILFATEPLFDFVER